MAQENLTGNVKESAKGGLNDGKAQISPSTQAKVNRILRTSKWLIQPKLALQWLQEHPEELEHVNEYTMFKTRDPNFHLPSTGRYSFIERIGVPVGYYINRGGRKYRVFFMRERMLPAEEASPAKVSE